MAMELLSPAGSPEGVRAAVQNGADALYLGLGGMNARRGAKNFTREEFKETAAWCRARGVKTYVTLNTLIYDREMEEACELARFVSDAGADAVLVQDLGLAAVLRKALPDLPLHASTQLSVWNLEGVKRAADLGMSRVVLARELPKSEIAYICEHSPVEIEVFAHGALCFCYSGQCYFSAMIGGRSGNRGACAQPCRLEYGFGGSGEDRKVGHPMSLKDLSLASHLKELEALGVSCVKLEGRMKRPEYAALVTRVFADALREGREPTREEMKMLELVFSRSGFTDGYFTGRKGPEMLGIREEADAAARSTVGRLFEETRRDYEKGPERSRVPVSFACHIAAGKPAMLAAEDREGNRVIVAGGTPEPARTKPLLTAEVNTQLYKTGGTPFLCEYAKTKLDDGLSLPLKEINALRRSALTELEKVRQRPPARRSYDYTPPRFAPARKDRPEFIVQVREISQVSDRLLRMKPARLYLPLSAASKDPMRVRELLDTLPVAVVLPRVSSERERPALEMELSQAAILGVREAVVGNLGLMDAALKWGFTLRGDFGLNVANSHSLAELKRLGFRSATVSFELTFPRIRDLQKPLDCEFLAYGRLPLMITEQCIVKNKYGDCRCDNNITLVDRTGERFPVLRESDHRNGVYNAHKLWLAEKQADWEKLGLWAARLYFTTENPRECEQVLYRYQGEGNYSPNKSTRGLYYRGAE